MPILYLDRYCPNFKTYQIIAGLLLEEGYTSIGYTENEGVPQSKKQGVRFNTTLINMHECCIEDLITKGYTFFTLNAFDRNGKPIKNAVAFFAKRRDTGEYSCNPLRNL